jgi:hypothetical protein
MRRRIVQIAGVAVWLGAGLPTVAQEGHPLTGTWSGDWGPPAGPRTHLTVVMNWDGKVVSAVVNPGPEAVAIERVSLDVTDWTVRFEGDAKDQAGAPLRIAAEGRLEDLGSWHRKLVGRWTQASVAGDFTIARDGVSTAAVSPPAPRSFAATYDDDRKVTLEGIVTRVEWVNPRAFVFVNARDSSGIVTNWAVEIGSPLDLERDGWKRTALAPGDQVTVEGLPAWGDARRAFATSLVLTRTRKPVFVPPSTRRAATAAPAPRWPDGQIRLGPPPGGKGYWGPASIRTLVERTAGSVALNGDGLLVNIADADRVAPFQPWAKALYLHRQRTLLRDDPVARCLPAGGPRQFHTPHGFQFLEQRELGRILVLLGGGNRNWRVIHTDGRPQGQPAEVVLSYYGHSIGRWEKDTLVVDSVGFNERFWLTSGGLPHTEALHLVERFTRVDLNTLRYEVTVDDPRTYTRPWSGGWTIQWVPDREIEEFFCEENAESTFIR